MRKTTKDDIFDLLTLVLSAATSALVIWAIASFCGKTDHEVVEMFPAFVFIAAFAYVPWVYTLDFVFRLFENKNSKKRLTNGK